MKLNWEPPEKTAQAALEGRRQKEQECADTEKQEI